MVSTFSRGAYDGACLFCCFYRRFWLGARCTARRFLFKIGAQFGFEGYVKGEYPKAFKLITAECRKEEFFFVKEWDVRYCPSNF